MFLRPTAFHSVFNIDGQIGIESNSACSTRSYVNATLILNDSSLKSFLENFNDFAIVLIWWNNGLSSESLFEMSQVFTDFLETTLLGFFDLHLFKQIVFFSMDCFRSGWFISPKTAGEKSVVAITALLIALISSSVGWYSFERVG